MKEEATILSTGQKNDHFSFSIPLEQEKWSLELMEEVTELSLIDFIHAERSTYTHEDGRTWVEYRWKISNVSQEKYKSLETWAKALFMAIKNKTNSN